MIKIEIEETPIISPDENVVESQRISPKIGSGQNLTKCVLCEKLDGDYIGRNIDDLHSHASVHQRSMRIMAGNSKSLLFDSVFALCFPEYSKTIDNSYSRESPRMQLFSALTVPTTTNNSDQNRDGDKAIGNFVYDDISSADVSIDNEMFIDKKISPPITNTIIDNDSVVKIEEIDPDNEIESNNTQTSMIVSDQIDRLIIDQDPPTVQTIDNAALAKDMSDDENQTRQLADEIFKMSFKTISIWCSMCTALVPVASGTDIIDHMTSVHVSIDSYHQGSREEIQTWRIDRQEQNQVWTKVTSKTDTYILDQTYWSEVKQKLAYCFGEETENLECNEASLGTLTTETIIGDNETDEQDIAPSGNMLSEISLTQRNIDSDHGQRSVASADVTDQQSGAFDRCDQTLNSKSISRAEIADRPINRHPITEIIIDNLDQISKESRSLAKNKLKELLDKRNNRNKIQSDPGGLANANRSPENKRKRLIDESEDDFDPSAKEYRHRYDSDSDEDDELEKINKNRALTKARPIHKKRLSSKSTDEDPIEKPIDRVSVEKSITQSITKKRPIADFQIQVKTAPPKSPNLNTDSVIGPKKSVDKERSLSKSDTSIGSEKVDDQAAKIIKNRKSIGGDRSIADQSAKTIDRSVADQSAKSIYRSVADQNAKSIDRPEINRKSIDDQVAKIKKNRISIDNVDRVASKAGNDPRSITPKSVVTTAPPASNQIDPNEDDGPRSLPVNEVLSKDGFNFKCLRCGDVFQNQFKASDHSKRVHQITLLPFSKKVGSGHCDSTSSAGWSQSRSTELITAPKLNKVNNGTKHYQK